MLVFYLLELTKIKRSQPIEFQISIIYLTPPFSFSSSSFWKRLLFLFLILLLLLLRLLFLLVLLLLLLLLPLLIFFVLFFSSLSLPLRPSFCPHTPSPLCTHSLFPDTYFYSCLSFFVLLLALSSSFSSSFS